jgi:hypothetical protein
VALNIDWEFLIKDALTMIKMLADKVTYESELNISCWQLVNLEIIENKKMRDEVELARKLRLY